MVNIVLFGPPGSGKGLQVSCLKKKYNFYTIALGELLRQQIKENGLHKTMIEAYVNHGNLVPDHISCSLVEEIVQQHAGTGSLLFDGFPRHVGQATFLDDLLARQGKKIHAVVALDVPESILVKRLQRRALIEGRADDQALSKIQKRMEVYQKDTLPILDYYQSQGKVHKVDGSADLDRLQEITHAIADVIDQCMAKHDDKR